MTSAGSSTMKVQVSAVPQRFLAAALHWLHRGIDGPQGQNSLGFAGPQCLRAKYWMLKVWL
jgi:hypothetical protein